MVINISVQYNGGFLPATQEENPVQRDSNPVKSNANLVTGLRCINQLRFTTGSILFFPE